MKKFLLCLVIVNFLIFSLYAQSLSDSLILYYPFDGNAMDQSINELHGTLNGPTLTFDRFGNENSAYYFDGENDVIEFPFSQLLKPDFPITVSFWVELKSVDFNYNRFFATEFQFNNYAGCWMVCSEGNVKLSFGGNIGGAGIQYRCTKISGVEITTDNWYHIVGIIRGKENMDIYVNGINTGGSYEGVGPETIGYSSSTGKIGSLPGQATNPDPYYFWGYMDDFAIWSRELSQQEIIDLFNNGSIITKIDEEKLSNFSISPNPVKDVFVINTSKKGLEIENVRIVSLAGIEQAIYRNGHRININKLINGIYFVEISLTNGQKAVQKIIKNDVQ